MVTLGTGNYTYEVVENWAKLPDGWGFKEVAAVGVDANDNVYAFNRGAHPMMVFDRHGNFLRSWGEGLFPRAHGITASPDGTFFCTDDGDHTVRKCTLDGKVLFTLGMSGKPAPFMSGEPFNRCTHVAIDPRNGDFYVSDGYCNARVHKYSPDGKLLFSWGESGTDPGEFNIVHNIATDSAGWVYVADRENHRIQVFDPTVSLKRSGSIWHGPVACISTKRAISPMWVNSVWPSLPMPRPTALAHALASTIPKATSWHAWVTSRKVKPLANSSRPTAFASTLEATST
jgi:NHL repeat